MLNVEMRQSISMVREETCCDGGDNGRRRAAKNKSDR